MTLEDLGNIGEFIASIGVIVSLIYLATQIRQNTALALGSAQREITNAYQGNEDRIARNGKVFREGLQRFESLSKDDQFVFHTCMSAFVNHLDQVLHMRDLGLETEDNVETYGYVCLSLLGEPGARAWWEMVKQGFLKEARAYLDTRLADPGSLPEPISQQAPYFVSDPP